MSALPCGLALVLGAGLATAGVSGPRVDAAVHALGEALAAGHPLPAAALPEPDGTFRVVVEGADASALAAAIEGALGLEVEAAGGPAGAGLVQVRLSATDLPALGTLGGAVRVRLPRLPSPPALAPAAGPKREGAVETEGLAGVFAAGDWHRAGYTGRGVDIAVLDVGFLGAEALAGTELPRRLHLSGPGDDTSAHGTAVAEIIHDIAPDARLHLRRFRTDAELVAATEALSADGVQVLNASVGFDNLWPSDGTSPWSVAARDAVDAGVAWVAAAGNEGRRYIVGPLADDDGDGVYTIGGAGSFPVGPGPVWLVLRWDEPMGGATRDLRLVLRPLGGGAAQTADAPQAGSGDPVEVLIDGTTDRTLRLTVEGPPGGPPGWAWLYTGGAWPEGMATPGAPSLTQPADAAGAVAVGACDAVAGTVPAWASQGPTEDGRLKPDLCAPTGVSTASFGPGAFGGSSAAAPHVAGALALLAEATGWADPLALRAAAWSLAVDQPPDGPDRQTGYGALALGPPPPRCACAAPAASPPLGWAALLASFALSRRRRLARPRQSR